MSTESNYAPPEVWTQAEDDGNKWASINRPVSGATHEKARPNGEHGLQLYSLATPNGQKVTIMLEELLAAGVSEAEYDAWLINIGEGDQFSSGFGRHDNVTRNQAIRVWVNLSLLGGKIR